MAQFRRIATEEAWSTPEVAEMLRLVSRGIGRSLDLPLVRAVYDKPDGESPILKKLLDTADMRIRTMDENNVDVHLLALTSPGVQMFTPREAVRLAKIANDRLAEVVAAHPDRFAWLASFAPQDPAAAVEEIHRARTELGANGFMVNSHTDGEYLDQEKFWPILEALNDLRAPLYIHPRAVPEGFDSALRDYGIETAIWGYGVETGTHAVRLIMSGVFDRFPELKIVLGHMGEGVPFWLWRMDRMGDPRRRRPAHRPPYRMAEAPSYYFKRNFAITTSGMESVPALKYSIDVLGDENVMWAIDYPYQDMPDAVKFMDEADIPDESKAKIYSGNAERIFGISPN